jgi:hypothetical protein
VSNTRASGVIRSCIAVCLGLFVASLITSCGGNKAKDSSGMTDEQRTKKMMTKMQEDAKAGKAPGGAPAKAPDGAAK